MEVKRGLRRIKRGETTNKRENKKENFKIEFEKRITELQNTQVLSGQRDVATRKKEPVNVFDVTRENVTAAVTCL